MFKFEIGKDISDVEMSDTIKQALGEFSFPLNLEIENVMPFSIIDTNNGLISLDGNLNPNGNTKGQFYFETLGTFIRFADNMLTIAKLNGFERAIIVQTLDYFEEDAGSKEDGTSEKNEKPKRSRRMANTETQADELAEETANIDTKETLEGDE